MEPTIGDQSTRTTHKNRPEGCPPLQPPSRLPSSGSAPGPVRPTRRPTPPGDSAPPTPSPPGSATFDPRALGLEFGEHPSGPRLPGPPRAPPLPAAPLQASTSAARSRDSRKLPRTRTSGPCSSWPPRRRPGGLERPLAPGHRDGARLA